MIFSFFDYLQAQISESISIFNSYAKEYPFVAGTLSLWFLGVISYLFRGIPRKLWELLKRTSTLTVTVMSSSDSFHNFINWYQIKGHDKKGRYLKISNGRWGDGEAVKSLGYGIHYFWYNRRLIILKMTKIEVQGSDRERDEITMILFGRSHKTFDLLFKEINLELSKEKVTIIKRFSGSHWERMTEQPPRKLDTIFLRRGVKKKLIQHIDGFINREQWYLDHGIPYQTGILLYGPPGTGKTSIIRAISDYLDYQIYSLSISYLWKIQEIVSELPNKTILLIEDIDSEPSTEKRITQEFAERSMDQTEQPEAAKTKQIFSLANLSDIVNAIDGIHVNHGRVLFVTTNHIEKLDPALLRPGRIDLKLKIDYIDEQVVYQFFKAFYPAVKLPDNFRVAVGISSAVLQNAILENIDNPNQVLRQITSKEITSDLIHKN